MENIKNTVEKHLEIIIEKKEKRKKYISYFKYVLSILGPALVVLFLLNFVVGLSTIKGRSMDPGLHENDIVIFNRLDKSIKQFDVIVAKKNKEDVFIIKRAIGLPNDIVDIKDGFVYVNDVKLDESKYTLNGVTMAQDVTFPIQLKSNEYFVLGDNREISMDSRNSHTGLILKDHVLGKVFLIIRSKN